MNQEQLNKIIATTTVVTMGTVMTFATVSFIEQIRKDRTIRKAHESMAKSMKRIDDMFTSEKFEKIVKENDL